MSFEQDPPRLSESGDGAMREALRAAKGDLPGAERMAALGAAFELSLGVPASVAPPTVATGASIGASKIIATALVVVIGGGSYYAAQTTAPRESPRAPHAHVVRVARENAPLTVVETPAPAQNEAHETVVEVAFREDGSVPSEVTLLADARNALAGSPARALRLLETHRRAYPTGSLSQEREVMSIEALAALGRSDVVVTRATRFLESHAGSAHAARIRVLLAGARTSEAAREQETTPRARP